MTLIVGLQILVIAFLAEFIDSTLGMGYGTILTPVLLLMGFSPLSIVPSVLMSEFLTGLLAGFSHHKAGNVNFKQENTNLVSMIKHAKEIGYFRSLKKNTSRHFKVAMVLALCSIVGTVLAVFIAVNISKYLLKLYIGILITVIGLVILFTAKKTYKFSWKRIVGLGLIASFNKGISGGGYGPVVTGGQVLSGVETKGAIGITSLAEGLTCLVGIIIYFITVPNLNLTLAPYITVGALLSVPFAVHSIKRMTANNLRMVIGFITLFLGFLTILQTVM